MLPAIKLQALNLPKPLVSSRRSHNITKSLPSHRPSDLRQPVLRFSSLSLQSENASASGPAPSRLTSSVGSPPSAHLVQWNLTHRHILILNAIACTVAISASWLFFSAIPTLLAFKRAAESLEKLLDVTREELPDTMAAVRLSGMEISDLTMELSDLGQEITQGVRRSTRAVRLAEDRLRQLTNIVPRGANQSKDRDNGTSDS
ncbi:PREDICTED: uncharacterized protein LOC104600025 isoform X2 [Nelumbo nucifera]|uniref:Uncharacterized protein LOC104600025 isoform X2 n=2 Tax=Nelumbo nucifera TaxID=4432 RepID=A0A1U8A281_NELNU|nr:PREDICTED: uncharacterized protein LOC104600025 isoform X2 [Nelumbo nucifera]DAD40197.1 TPA_asm: hypothetical protein HUJ06_014520 [Nelumbo nucifera]